MGYYTVLTPCVVGKLHYATIPAQPIAVDDSVAADLVDSGALAPNGVGQPNPPVVEVSSELLEPVAKRAARPSRRARRV